MIIYGLLLIYCVLLQYNCYILWTRIVKLENQIQGLINLEQGSDD